MKRLITALALTLALPTTVAMAADSTEDTVRALRHSPVYIAPGSPGVTPDTAGVLAASLHGGDNIAIAVLPSTPSDPRAFAEVVDRGLDGKQIVGIAFGNDFAAASSVLPAGVAVDLMNRAHQVSTGTQETLVTFVRNVHNWQSAHQGEPASKPQKKHDDGSSAGAIFIMLAIGAALIGAGVTYLLRKGGNAPVKFRDSPDDVRKMLKDLLGLREKINDAKVRAMLTSICQDTEAYFSRARKAGVAIDKDVETFREHLESLTKVLDKYIDVQNNGRYYYDEEKELAKGYRGVEGFAQFALDSCKRSAQRGLMDYNVDTDILDAQRFTA